MNAVGECVDNILKILDWEKCVVGLFNDLSKVFDSIICA